VFIISYFRSGVVRKLVVKARRRTTKKTRKAA